MKIIFLIFHFFFYHILHFINFVHFFVHCFKSFDLMFLKIILIVTKNCFRKVYSFHTPQSSTYTFLEEWKYFHHSQLFLHQQFSPSNGFLFLCFHLKNFHKLIVDFFRIMIQFFTRIFLMLKLLFILSNLTLKLFLYFLYVKEITSELNSYSWTQEYLKILKPSLKYLPTLEDTYSSEEFHFYFLVLLHNFLYFHFS